ncbi:MAG: DUF6765 family protein [Acidaminococcaceae bacterium]
MQTDMHYYGTYAMAVAAGIPKEDAAVIAYASQFVDDSTGYDSDAHEDGGLLFGITTAHNPVDAFIKATDDQTHKLEDERRVWVPFHFFPGGEGENFHEKILCVKDGDIVNEMFENYLKICNDKTYCLELIGIASHVYADTFSHYGFSGLTSPYNLVNGDAEIKNKTLLQDVYDYIIEKKNNFWGKFGMNTIELGHAGVATYPDRPFLEWNFEFTLPRPGNEQNSNRNNQTDYLEGCQKLHSFLCNFAQNYYSEANQKAFNEIEDSVREVLAVQGCQESRIQAWKDSGLIDGVPDYDANDWENEKNSFSEFESSLDGISTHAYRFHQAAAYHRYYVLKDLLPSHGIAIY